MADVAAQPVEQDVQQQESESGVTEIESLCMQCHENVCHRALPVLTVLTPLQGTTRLLLYHIPFFREVLISSFDCDHCGHSDKSVRPAGKIQEKGSKYTLRVDDKKDLERQIVRGDTAVFRIEDIDLEMPTGASQLTNIEGILFNIYTEMEAGQALRKIQTPEIYEALQNVIEKIKKMMTAEALPFTISIDDPSGNSFIEPSADDKGHKYARHDYLRSPEQNEALGLGGGDEELEVTGAEEEPQDSEIVNGVVYTLHETCPACAKQCQVNMQKVQIPHFKEVYIMATNCGHCGYRTSDVKTGGEVPEKGKRITLQVQNITDLSRDLLKSETCVLKVPEIDLYVEPGTLGGRFTTVEGLLTQVQDQLRGQVYDIGSTEDTHNSETSGIKGGDSMSLDTRQQWESFFTKLSSIIKVEKPFSIVLEDPLANSFVQSLSDAVVDEQIEIVEYERSAEENEGLGLLDMKTEGYQHDEAAENKSAEKEEEL